MRKYLFLAAAVPVIFTIIYLSETSIHIIRHGEKVIDEGVSDAPLTEAGIEQAKELGRILANEYKIDQLFVSPMRRARQTAESISSATKSKMVFDDRLTEKNYRRSDDLYPDDTNVFVKYFPDGSKENKEQHLSRLLGFFKDKISILDKEVWIVAHGGLIRRLLEKIQQEKIQDLPELKIKYCSNFEFSYNKLTGTIKYVSHSYSNSPKLSAESCRRPDLGQK
ncbi:MAG: histidine phosphatase family protein [Deltaproteobacteria bacterium]|nr:histidine phosphatase family protein [Deltaproteobacteria bacterium]